MTLREFCETAPLSHAFLAPHLCLGYLGTGQAPGMVKFDLSTRSFITKKPSWNNPSIIESKQVVRPQYFR